MTKCKSCGKSEGFIVTEYVSATQEFYYDSNGNLSSICESDFLAGKTKQKLICQSCDKFYGWFKDCLGKE